MMDILSKGALAGKLPGIAFQAVGGAGALAGQAVRDAGALAGKLPGAQAVGGAGAEAGKAAGRAGAEAGKAAGRAGAKALASAVRPLSPSKAKNLRAAAARTINKKTFVRPGSGPVVKRFAPTNANHNRVNKAANAALHAGIGVAIQRNLYSSARKQKAPGARDSNKFYDAYDFYTNKSQKVKEKIGNLKRVKRRADFLKKRADSLEEDVKAKNRKFDAQEKLRNTKKKERFGEVAKATLRGALANNAKAAAATAARREPNAARAAAFSREYLHPGYYAQRARRAQQHIGLIDIFAQFTGYLAEPIDFNEPLVRATRVSAMASGTPYDLNSTPPLIRRAGTDTPFLMRDLDKRIDTLLDQFLLDVPERTIDAQSVLFEMLRQGLSTYTELLRSVTVEAREALRPMRRAYADYISEVVDTRRPQIRKLQANLAETRKTMGKRGLNTKAVSRLRFEERRLLRQLAAVQGNGSGVVTKNTMGAKQLAQMRQVKELGYNSQARALGVRFLETQVRQRRSAVTSANGKLKKWACPTAKSDKTFLASGRIACVDARLHSPILQEYATARASLKPDSHRRAKAGLIAFATERSAAKEVGRTNNEFRNRIAKRVITNRKKDNNKDKASTGPGAVLADVREEEVPLRTVFGDRLVKRNLVLHSFLDTLSDALLSLNPSVKMNPTAARLRNAMKVSYHPFQKRFEEAGGMWRAPRREDGAFPRRELRATEPDVEPLAWSAEVGSFGSAGPQPYWIQLLREMYDAQRVFNVRAMVRSESFRKDGTQFRGVGQPEFAGFVGRAKQLLQTTGANAPSAIKDNLGVTAAGYILNFAAGPTAPWIKSYHRFGRAWYVDDYEAKAKYQLPFGAYREDMYEDGQSGPQEVLLDVYLNQIATHLTSTDVACRYGHVLTDGVATLPPFELYQRLERVRGPNGYYALRSKGKETPTSYADADGVETGRAGPTLQWELANGCGMIYGTRSPNFFGGGKPLTEDDAGAKPLKNRLRNRLAGGDVTGTRFAPAVPQDWSRRSAELFKRDVEAMVHLGRSKRTINGVETPRNVREGEKRNIARAKQFVEDYVNVKPTGKRLKNTHAEVRSRYGANRLNDDSLAGRVNQSVITFHMGEDSPLAGSDVLDQMRHPDSKATGWYPASKIAAIRREKQEQSMNPVLTGHDMTINYLRQHGFGLRSHRVDGANAPNIRKKDMASIEAANREKLVKSVVLVDGEIHCAQQHPKIPSRFAGSAAVVSSSERVGLANVPRRIPLASSTVPGMDKSRQARQSCMAMADLLQSDATSGYDGLKRRLKENLLKPLFYGKMVLRYFHFHDVLMRFSRLTENSRFDTWSAVLKLMDSPDTGDMMDCIMYYILCYTGVPKAQAARKLTVLHAMRRTRQGREALMNAVKDLRLLGDDGPMSNTIFKRIARHLLSTQSTATKGRLTTKNVNAEVATLQKNVDRKNLTRRFQKAVGYYTSTDKRLGMANGLSADQLLKRRGLGIGAIRPTVGVAVNSATNAKSGVFGRRGALRGKNVTRGPPR